MSGKQMRMVGIVIVVLSLFSLESWGEWSADPAQNLLLADRTNEQVQPKIAVAVDGGIYVSWFDNSAGGYDVSLQRLDPQGNEMWNHNGILIADRSLSWTVDYDLSVDHANNALLAFQDDRFGVNEQITVTKVSPSGEQLWGA